MEDYTGNSKKDKEENEEKKPKKKIERVTTGEVLIKKKGLGEKMKDMFVAADLKSVTAYVVYDILVPAFKNMFVDSISRGVERMTFGERGMRPRGPGAPHMTYMSPVRRGFTGLPMQDNLDRRGLPSRQPMVSNRPQVNTEPILATREDAALVLERMTDIVDQYQVVTVGDLNSLLGIPSTHVDEKWGWDSIVDIQIRQIREGYLLDLPQPQPLQ